MNTMTAAYTGQLYFDEETNAAVSKVLPYSSSPVSRTLNKDDEIFNNDKGTQTTLQLTGSATTGFTATTYVIGIERPKHSVFSPLCWACKFCKNVGI